MKKLILLKLFSKKHFVFYIVRRYAILVVCLLYLFTFYGTRAIRSTDYYDYEKKKTYGYLEYQDLIEKHFVGTNFFWHLFEDKEIFVAGIKVSEIAYERLYYLSWIALVCSVWILLTIIKAPNSSKIKAIGILILAIIAFEKVAELKATEIAIRKEIHTLEKEISSLNNKIDDFQKNTNNNFTDISLKLGDLEYQCSRSANIHISY